MGTKTHLLVCNIEYPPIGGGAGPMTQNLVAQLISRHQYTVDVVTMGFQDLPSTDHVSKHLTIHRIPAFRSNPQASHPWQHAIYLKRAETLITKLHQQHSFDLCHAHFLVPTGILALRLKKRLNLPYIITAHGTDVPGHNPNRFTLMHRFTKPIITNIINQASAIVTPSDYLRQQILSRVNPTKNNHLVLIKNGINTNHFTPMSKHNYIVSTGRLISGKGFTTLISAVKEQDLGWPLHIVGTGNLEADIRKLAVNSKTQIVFHGWLDNQSKTYQDLLGHAAIFTLASAVENASLSILEALSSGCATLVGRGSGSQEMVDQAGMTINHGDVKQLSHVLNLLIKDQKKRRQLQVRARKKAIMYSWPRITQKYHQLIQSTIYKKSNEFN